MKRTLLFAGAFFLTGALSAQSLAPLTVEKIMRDPRWIGTSPSDVYWSENSQTVYFQWNPDRAPSDSLYGFALNSQAPVKIQPATRRQLPAKGGSYNKARTQKVYEKWGDIYLVDVQSGQVRTIMQTAEGESNPRFSADDQKIYYSRGNNIYSYQLANGATTQLTNFKTGKKEPEKPTLPPHEEWLKAQQRELLQVVREKQEKEKISKQITEAEKPRLLEEIYTEDKTVVNIQLSPDERFVTYNLFKAAKPKTPQVPDFIHESGFTTDLNTRSKVGSPQGEYEFWLYDRQSRKATKVSTQNLPGIGKRPAYLQDYQKQTTVRPKGKKGTPAPAAAPQPEYIKKVAVFGPDWSEDGRYAVAVVRSADNKDRWIVLLDPQNGALTTLDHQHDEAWIGGPGVGGYAGKGNGGWLADNETYWFQSEETGYSHLYTLNVRTKRKQALTRGNYEVQDARLSADKQRFFIITNQVHPGEQHFYHLPVSGGEATRITTMTGANEVSVSPDERMLAIRYSFSNRPWELYVMPNQAGAQARQVTSSLTEEFKSYEWRVPENVTFKARDGANVPARLYKPKQAAPGNPAVIFVHGAGYLQNAHKWWSTYFREYMFHNLLADQGYTVLDIDYRGSSGYGRDWRTGIYRHMGGKDLSDHIDGARFLVEQHGVDPARLGIYGGSYGGFITLMAMFTEPDVFAAGAALRSVTDWAHYNHPYTSNILNEPVSDSIAYVRSSPIYFAEGLKGHLLICHGMVDVNVHFQDVVRLSQRLIELGKDNWEMAIYPAEDHGFTEPSSWTDEYKRIYKLFERTLKQPVVPDGSR